MQDRTRFDPAKRIPTESPDVSAQLKTRLEAVLRDEFSNEIVGQPLLVTKFPKQTGPLFKVTIHIDDVEPEIHR